MVTSARPPASAAARFETLDALRGICALFVALFHFQAQGLIAALPLVRNGWLFVDYFFVLSGFVIAHGYGARLQRGEISSRHFMALRFARVYPLHLAVLLAFVAVELALWLLSDQLAGLTARQPFGGSRDLPSLIENLFLLQSFGLRDGLSWNGPAWSISAEMWTYVLFAGVFLLRGKGSIVASVGLAALTLWFIASRTGSIDLTYDFGVVRAVLGFALGVLTYSGFRRIGAPRGTIWELAAISAAVAIVSLTSGRATMAAPFVFAATIWLLAGEGGAVARVLKMRGFQLLGLLSYSIYMVHIFVQAQMGDMLQMAGVDGVSSDAQGRLHIAADSFLGDLLTLSMLVVVVATSWLTYRLVEVPGQRYLRRLIT